MKGENSPKLKTIVGWRVQQWGVVSDGAVKERKERKGGRDRAVKREGESAGNWEGRLQSPFRSQE
jgi:hypothetical protein